LQDIYKKRPIHENKSLIILGNLFYSTTGSSLVSIGVTSSELSSVATHSSSKFS
jgi:hypothetical protein